MLHTKFCGNRPAGSGEEDFLKVFTIYGHGGHLGHVTWTIYTNFRSPFPRRLHIQVSPDKPRSDLTRKSVERGCLMDPKIFPQIPNPLIFKSVAL